MSLLQRHPVARLTGHAVITALNLIDKVTSHLECAVSGHEWVRRDPYTAGCVCCGRLRILNGGAT